MGAVYFYHLTRKPLEATLPLLLSKALGAGWRCLVVGNDPARLNGLDKNLWNGKNTDFLAHGRAGGPNDVDQPILLSPKHTTENLYFKSLMLIRVNWHGLQDLPLHYLEKSALNLFFHE